VFCEAKRHKRDRISPSQVKFIDGALKCGLSRQSLVIVEWSSPCTPPAASTGAQ
jgi:hypothetical protein